MVLIKPHPWGIPMGIIIPRFLNFSIWGGFDVSLMVFKLLGSFLTCPEFSELFRKILKNHENHDFLKNEHTIVCLEQTDTCNMTVWRIRSCYGFDEKLTLTW